MTTTQNKAGTPLAMSCSRRYVVRVPVSTSVLERRRADDEAAVSKNSTGRTESDVDEADESGRTDGRVRADRTDGAVALVAPLLLDGTNALADDDTRCATNARRVNFIFSTS